MAKPMSWGPSRSGFYDAVRGANILNEDSFKCKANPANDSGVEDFDEGEFAIIGTDEKAEKISGVAAVPAYPVVIGFERADVRGSGTTTLALGRGAWVETSGWDAVNKTADDFPIGTECCVKDGLLFPAQSGEMVQGIVRRGAKTTQTMAQKALRKSAFTTIVVELVYYKK